MPRLALLCGALTLMACGSPTAPAAPPKLADAARTAAQLGAVGAPGATPVFLSFAALTPYFTAVDSALPSPVARALLVTRTLGAWRRGWSSRVASAPAGVIIPAPALGKTFVWDTLGARYVASAETGAPAGAARFDLYSITPGVFPAVPLRPLAPLGHTDLSDASTAGTSSVGVALVGPGATPFTYASYSVSRPTAGTVAQLSLGGYVSDGTTQLDVTSTATETATQSTLHVTGDIAAQDAHMVETVTFAGLSSTTVGLDFSLSSGSETIAATGSLTVDTVALTSTGSLAVTVNGQALATITLGPQGVDVTPAPGVTLDATDRAALDALFVASVELLVTTSLLEFPALVLGV